MKSPTDPLFFKTLIRTLPDLVWLKDTEGVFLACNPRFEALYGAPEEKIIGRRDEDFVPKELAEFFRHHDLAAMAAGRPTINEEVLTFADGHREHVQTIKTPMRDGHGRIIGVLGIARDITESITVQVALTQHRDRLAEAERIAHLGFWELNHVDGQLFWSDEIFRIFELDPKAFGASYSAFLNAIHPDDREAVNQAFTDSVQNRTPYFIRHRLLFHDGRIKHVEERGETLYAGDGRPLRSQGTVQDITEMMETRTTLAERQAVFSTIVDQARDSIALVDLDDGHFVEFNQAAHANLGYSRQEFAGLTVADIDAQDSPEQIRKAFARMATPEGMQVETVHRRKDGAHRHVRVSARGISLAGKIYLAAIWSDITEKKEAEARILHLSQFDTLTNLPNRHMLLDRLGQALATGVRTARHGALLICDLDRFKTINDARGHERGDQVLGAIGQRLHALIRESDTLSRLSADEFAILLAPDETRLEQVARGAREMVKRVLDALQEPFVVDGESFTLTASIGTTLFPENAGDTPAEVLRRADTALNRAKEAGGNRHAFYDAAMGDIVNQRFDVERELRQAIGDGQLRLYLQAQVHADGHRLAGAEALVRWEHPERGLIPPGLFIPIAEESDLIIDIDKWMAEAACRLVAREAHRKKPCRIAINVSPRHFRRAGFVPWVKALLAETGASADNLTLEVTEGLLVDDPDDVAGKMRELSRMGIHFALDDFGTGYSSLAYLKQLPFHEIKIDQSFVRDMTSNSENAALVETILAIARHMDLAVVAEGIETSEQAEFIAARSSGALLQGYHFSRPEPESDWLAHWACPST